MSADSTQRYKPATGTEGADFMAKFCDRCERDGAFDSTGNGCQILLGTMVFDVDDPEYPREWTYNAEGRPTCTAFAQIRTDRDLEAAGQLTLMEGP